MGSPLAGLIVPWFCSNMELELVDEALSPEKALIASLINEKNDIVFSLN